MPPPSTLIYIHDPMCSWCWGFRRSYQRLLAALPPHVEHVRLVGGLAADSDAPMPHAMQQYLQQTWRRIESTVPGTRFNHDYWTHCTPRRSTYPACRAVLAARAQAAEFDLSMTEKIQQGYYLEAKNPSDTTTLLEFAAELGLDRTAFAARLNAAATQHQLEQEMNQVRQFGVRGFPALVVVSGALTRPIQINYTQPEKMLASILQN